MEKYTDHPALSRQVIEMITVAHEYCLFIEESEKRTAEEIYAFFQKIAPLLYLKGALLPSDIEADVEFAERFVTEEQWEGIFKVLRGKFGDADIYYTHDENFDSRQASLADNFADIYQDMKDFVMLYQKAPMQSKAWAVSELQSLFERHWGVRVLKSLAVVHNVMYRDSLSPDVGGQWE